MPTTSTSLRKSGIDWNISIIRCGSVTSTSVGSWSQTGKTPVAIPSDPSTPLGFGAGPSEASCAAASGARCTRSNLAALPASANMVPNTSASWDSPDAARIRSGYWSRQIPSATLALGRAQASATSSVPSNRSRWRLSRIRSPSTATLRCGKRPHSDELTNGSSSSSPRPGLLMTAPETRSPAPSRCDIRGARCLCRPASRSRRRSSQSRSGL